MWIYLYISMGTTLCMMLLFTQSSRICRVNVGSHAIVFKSLRFGRFTLKHNHRSFQTKTGFKSLGFRLWKHRSSVNDNRSKLWVLKRTSVNGAWVCILFATSNQILIQEPNWTLKCILDPQFPKVRPTLKNAAGNQDHGNSRPFVPT